MSKLAERLAELYQEVQDPHSALHADALLVSDRSAFSLRCTIVVSCNVWPLLGRMLLWLLSMTAISPVCDGTRMWRIFLFAVSCQRLRAFFFQLYVLLLSSAVYFSLPLLVEEPTKRIRKARLAKEDFSCVKVIGRGAFGEVQLVRRL